MPIKNRVNVDVTRDGARRVECLRVMKGATRAGDPCCLGRQHEIRVQIKRVTAFLSRGKPRATGDRLPVRELPGKNPPSRGPAEEVPPRSGDLRNLPESQISTLKRGQPFSGPKIPNLVSVVIRGGDQKEAVWGNERAVDRERIPGCLVPKKTLLVPLRELVEDRRWASA